MRWLLCYAVVASTVPAQEVSQPVCSAEHSNCSTCSACCFDGMDAATCHACVTSECRAAPTPAPVAHRCLGDCNVCDQCCKAFLVDPAACASCVAEECHSTAVTPPLPSAVPFDCTLPREMPSSCSTSAVGDLENALEKKVLVRKSCLEQCWAPWSPCLRRPAPHDPCPSTVHLLLMLAVLIPYGGRVLGEYLFRLIAGGFAGRDAQYDVLDDADEGMRSSYHKKVTVRKKDTREHPVEEGVKYTYSAVVQGDKDCKMGLFFKSSATGALVKVEAVKRQQSLTGQYTPHENGRLEFRFDNTYSWYYDKAVSISVNPVDWPKPPDRRVHMSYICSKGPLELNGVTHWAEARGYLKLTECGAYTRTLGRLLFWHVLQPCAYFGAFRTVSYQLDWAQYILGALVGVREVIYLVVTFAALVKNPTFLLIDVGACYTDRNATGHDSRTKIMNGGPAFLLMYTCMPEKVVDRALFSSGGVGTAAVSPVKVVGALFDLVGVAALVYGLSRGVLPPVLAVGYCMTALGGAVMLFEIATATDGGQYDPWDGSPTRMGRLDGIGGGPPYSGGDGLGGEQLRRMESTRLDSTISPHGSPRSPASPENLYEPVKVFSKSANKWCEGHVVLRTADIQRVKYHVPSMRGNPAKEMQKDMPLDSDHVRPQHHMAGY